MLEQHIPLPFRNPVRIPINNGREFKQELRQVKKM